MLKCKNCKKEFPLPSILEVPYYAPGAETEFSRRLVKKPCCGFCHSLELELTKEDLDVLREEFAVLKKEFAILKKNFGL